MMVPIAWCDHQKCDHQKKLAWCCCSQLDDDDDNDEHTVNHHVLPALIDWQQSLVRLVHPMHPYAKFDASNPPGFGVAPTLHPTWISKPGGAKSSVGFTVAKGSWYFWMGYGITTLGSMLPFVASTVQPFQGPWCWHATASLEQHVANKSYPQHLRPLIWFPVLSNTWSTWLCINVIIFQIVP